MCFSEANCQQFMVVLVVLVKSISAAPQQNVVNVNHVHRLARVHLGL